MAVSKAGEIQAFDIDVLFGAELLAISATAVFEANQILNITGGRTRTSTIAPRRPWSISTRCRPRSTAPSAT